MKFYLIYGSLLFLCLFMIPCSNPERPPFEQIPLTLTIYSDSEYKDTLKSNMVFQKNDTLYFGFVTNKPSHIAHIRIRLLDSQGKALYDYDKKPTTIPHDGLFQIGHFELTSVGEMVLAYEILTKDTSITQKYSLIVQGIPPLIYYNKGIQIPVEPKYNSFFVMYIEAFGSEPIEYKWYRNKDPIISHSTNVCKIEKLTFHDTGSYYCKVKNAWGESKSKPYLLALKNDVTKPIIKIVQPKHLFSPIADIDLIFEILDESSLCSVTVNSASIFSDNLLFRTMIELQEGANDIRITAIDDSPLKNKTSELLIITYEPGYEDTIGPDIGRIEPKDSTTTYSTVRILFNVFDVSTVDYVTLNGKKVTSTSTVFSEFFDCGIGKNEVTIFARDKSDKQNSTTHTFVLFYDTLVSDTVKPVITPVLPLVKNDTVTTPEYVIKVDAFDKSGIRWVKINNKTAELTHGHYERKISLELGNNDISVIAHDNSDSENSDTMTISLYCRQGPKPVYLEDPIVQSPSSLKISWTRYKKNDFKEYQVFYSTKEGITTNSTLDKVIPDKNETECTIYNLTTNFKYYMRVYVVNKQNLFSGSNVVYKYTGNHQPQFVKLGIQKGYENKPITFKVMATDQDNNTLFYTMPPELQPPNFTNATFNTVTQQFSWIPSFTDAGVYKAFFVVHDNGPHPLSDTLEVTIEVLNTNRPPLITEDTSSMTAQAYVDFLYTDTVSTFDPDSDEVILSLMPGHFPQGMEISPEGIITWIPTVKIDSFNVWVCAKDQNTGIDTLVWTIRFPIRFHILSTLPLPLEAHSLIISDSVAFISIDDESVKTGGFCIVDIRDLTIPEIIKMYPINAVTTKDIALVNDTLFTANSDSGMQCFDVSNLPSPQLISQNTSIGSINSIRILDNFAYVANLFSGLDIIDISKVNELPVIGNYNPPNAEFRWDVEVVGTYAVLATDKAGLIIVDISTPSNPHPVGTYTGPNRIEDVAIKGTYAYCASYDSGFVIVDFSNPASPISVGKYADKNFNPYRVFVSDDYAFVSDWQRDLKVFDIRNPKNPIYVCPLENSTNTSRIIIRDRYAFLVSGATFRVYQVDNL